MGRGSRRLAASALATLALVGCAAPEATRHPEGQVLFRAGAAGADPASTAIIAGPPIRRLVVLVPAFDPTWQVAWPLAHRNTAGGGGAFAGLLTGMAVVQSVPMVLLFWPAAVGVIAGTTVMGALGQQMEGPAPTPADLGDRAALLEAVAGLQPDRLLREAVAEGLARRAGQSSLTLPWHPTWGPDTPATDPLAGARGLGADGVLDVGLEAFGLAAGEEAETLGVFVRVRARILESAGGGLRYERVLEHRPGRRLAGLPSPTTYTVEFLAMDQARVFRQELQEAIAAIARLLAEDPMLPLSLP